MKMTLIALTLAFSALPVQAQGPSRSVEQFCIDREDANFVKDLTLTSSNLMSFRNHGGLLNGGVCWWHSRFQRNALYLTIFKPEQNRPSEEEAKIIITQIRLAKTVVVIPGFKNFSQFTNTFEGLIQKEIEKWQKIDGIVKFAWIKGLSGADQVAPEKLKELMDKIYEDVEINKNISYNKLQLPGIDAHAWLVIHMEKVNGGYNLEILDSNIANQTEIYRYREGDKLFDYRRMFNFVPYLEKTNEMENIKKVIQMQCAK